MKQTQRTKTLEKIKSREAAIAAAQQRIAGEEGKIAAAKGRISAERQVIRKCQEEILDLKTRLLADKLRKMDGTPIEDVLAALSLVEQSGPTAQEAAPPNPAESWEDS